MKVVDASKLTRLYTLEVCCWASGSRASLPLILGLLQPENMRQAGSIPLNFVCYGELPAVC